MAGLELERLRKVYPGGQVAIADASFTVADGELLVLVGPSGCGKSTLLRMIAGLESISAGTFLGSNSGRYLQALRDRFRGEELADMLCYLRVHGELAVRAKGVLLMREAGLPELPIEAETRDRLTEFAHLERAIGKAGVLALRPLMMATGKEVWQLTLLRP